MRTIIAAATLLAACSGIYTKTALAQGPAQDYLYEERQFRNYCPRNLKFAAGACVPVCPAGFQDFGGYCRLINQGSPGGSRW